MDGFLASVEKRAYVIALAACRDQQTALDIVQDSMYSMVKSYANKPPEQWKPLFFKVLNNRITDQHRKRGFGRLTRWFGNDSVESEPTVDAVDQLPSEEISPENSSDSRNLNNAMELALATLSEKQRQALVLRLWQGLSVKEAAIAMEISEGSVKTHLSRAVHIMARHRALAQETNTSTVGSFISWFSWKTAVASTAVVALTIFATQQLYQTNPEQAIGLNDSVAANQVPQQVLIEDLELLTASDDIDFYQSVEFLEWMAINSG